MSAAFFLLGLILVPLFLMGCAVLDDGVRSLPLSACTNILKSQVMNRSNIRGPMFC